MKNFCNLLHYRADTVDNIKKYKSFHPLAGSEYDRLLSIYYYASGMNCSYSIITMEHILIDINVCTWLLRCVFANAIKTINRLHQTFTTCIPMILDIQIKSYINSFLFLVDWIRPKRKRNFFCFTSIFILDSWCFPASNHALQ